MLYGLKLNTRVYAIRMDNLSTINWMTDVLSESTEIMSIKTQLYFVEKSGQQAISIAYDNLSLKSFQNTVPSGRFLWSYLLSEFTQL